MDFARIAADWYRKHKRDLPWRRTKDPYRIWLSEVILQQTRVDQGMPYYHAFLEEFPTVQDLAKAKEEKVMRTWQGLGYYSRARNLHHTAKIIAHEWNGRFPDSFAGLIRLKGVGEYTAAAISSICYNEPKAVVDGNVYRVLSRIFGIDEPIDSTKGKQIFRELANELLDRNDPGQHNQAVMEFGAKQCVPKNPDCSVCPFAVFCVARKKDLIGKLPVKSKKTKVTDRFFQYFLLRSKGKILIRKRTGDDIWKNLYDLPLIETEKRITEKKLFASKEWKALIGKHTVTIKKVNEEKRHLLSHQRLHIIFIEAEVNGMLSPPSDCKWIDINSIDKYGFPIVIADKLKKM